MTRPASPSPTIHTLLTSLCAVVLLAAVGCADGYQPADGGADSGVTLPEGDSQPTTPNSPGTNNSYCGDGKADPDEACDGDDLAGKSCVGLGYDSGTLSCQAGCKLDRSGCKVSSAGGRAFGQKCGGSWGTCKSGLICVLFNEAGKKEGYCTKECSSAKPCPSSPAGAQCAFKITSGKTICGFLCSATNTTCPTGLSCTYASKGGYHYCTTDQAAKCGNGKRELSEECDGADVNKMSCKAFGYTGGSLKCTSACKLDKSGCSGKSTCGKLPPRDCTGGSSHCGKLVQFSPTQGTGYVVTHGATFSWVRRDTMMLIKYAAAAVACMMPGAYPLGQGDMSMSNGGTPATNGQLRHPKGTHDYGRDVDIAYYQKGTPNNYLRPVCPHSSGGKEAYHCTATPNLLDVPRTTLFIAKLLESSRVRVIGVDGQIGPLVKAEAQKLQSKGLITAASTAALSKKVAYETTNTKMGWYYFHHHHLHLSTYTSSYGSSSAPPAQPDWSGAPLRPELMPTMVQGGYQPTGGCRHHLSPTPVKATLTGL